MKKILAVTMMICLLIPTLAGCFSDPVQDDLLNYINKEIPTVRTLENSVSKMYTDITSDGNIDDATAATKFESELLPTSDELISKAKAIVPATDEVKKVHDKYIAALTAQHDGFKLYKDAYANSDVDAVTKANDQMTKALSTSEEFLTELRALEEKHNVEEVTDSSTAK